MSDPRSPFLASLAERARAAPRRILLPEGNDPRVREAAGVLVQEGLARPVLLGTPTPTPLAGVEVLEAASAALLDRLVAHVVARRAGKLDPDDARARLEDPLIRAAALVGIGEADGALAGAVRSTADVIRAALLGVGLAPGIGTVSSSFYMDVRDFRGRGREVLTFTDAGVVPTPTPEQLADIALAAARARVRVVGDAPRVAFLSFSTLGSAGGPEVEKVRRALARFREIA
ncbi:MAG: phosphate acetyltransferase, partial [Gemmatimonadetes bacterium]|nr:phosphate acetyltransferase [Gemmatimonadota bacterium]